MTSKAKAESLHDMFAIFDDYCQMYYEKIKVSSMSQEERWAYANALAYEYTTEKDPVYKQAIKEAIVLLNINTVYDYVLRKCERMSSYDHIRDMFQAGLEGFFYAIDKFKPTESVSVNTYARFWVKDKVDRCVEDCANVTHIPKTALSKALKKKAAAEEGDDWNHGKNAGKKKGRKNGTEQYFENIYALSRSNVRPLLSSDEMASLKDSSVQSFGVDESQLPDHRSQTSMEDVEENDVNRWEYILNNFTPSLSQDDKEKIFLHFVRQYSPREISEMTGTTYDITLSVIKKFSNGVKTNKANQRLFSDDIQIRMSKLLELQGEPV